MVSADTSPTCRADDRRTGIAASLVVGLMLVIQVMSLGAVAAPTWLRAPLVFHQPESRAEGLVVRMDGHFTAELAADPTLGRVERDFALDPADGAYRSARPLLGWVAWAASGGGRRPALAPAILVLTALAAGALTLAVSAAARSWGRRPRWPAAVLLAPGAALSIYNPGLTEVPAAALAVFGCVAYRRGRLLPAALLFTAAVLCRETLLLVPLGVALVAFWRATTRPGRLRPIVIVAAPAAAYVGWNAIVSWRLGLDAGGTGAAQMDLPGVGLVRGLTFWGPLEVVAVIVVLASLMILWRSGDPTLRTIAVLHVALGSVMAPVVWAEWWGFGRVMLPLSALALAVTGARDPATGAPAAAERASDLEAGSVTVGRRRSPVAVAGRS